MSRGFACPKCGERAEVQTVRKPATFLIVRYRACGCGWKVITEERLSGTRRPQPARPAK